MSEEPERLLRSVCAEIIDGVTDESLDDLRKRQSPELADIALAILTAYTSVTRKAAQARREERERCARVADTREGLSGFIIAMAIRELGDE